MKVTCDLKPCPFCGSTNCGPSSHYSDDWRVVCHSCGATGPTTHTPEDAKQAWGKRKDGE